MQRSIVDHYFPEISLTSLEIDAPTHKRQKFHKFSNRVKLRLKPDEDFVNELEDGKRLCLWFDYTDCKPVRFDVFHRIVAKAGHGSILRITLNASFDPQRKEAFLSDFEQILPPDAEDYFADKKKYLLLLQKMIRKVTLPQAGDTYSFLLVSSATYRDGAPILTVTGIKVNDVDIKKVHSLLRTWKFYCPNWDKQPVEINVPDLSLQERMKLAPLLPLQGKAIGNRLSRQLGYSIAKTDILSVASLENYADFSRYFPVFARLSI